jgi:hypothetical protein
MRNNFLPDVLGSRNDELVTAINTSVPSDNLEHTAAYPIISVDDIYGSRAALKRKTTSAYSMMAQLDVPMVEED